MQAIAQCLGASEQELDAALEEYVVDLMAADRGVQLSDKDDQV